MRQEVDIRFVVTSLAGSAQHLYENVYCQRGQMENLIKLHKAQLASDRMSCHSATANQVRLVLHTAAFWLMHGVRAAIPRVNPLASAEFATNPGAPDQNRRTRDRASRAHPRPVADELPEGRCSAPSRSACCRPAREPRGRAPRRAADQGRSTQTRRTASWSHNDLSGRIAGACLLTKRRAKTPPGVHDPG